MTLPSPSRSVKAPTPLEARLKDRVALAVGGELRAIEEAITAEIASSVPLVAEMGEFIAGAGGKRLRPILLLIAARLAGYSESTARKPGEKILATSPALRKAIEQLHKEQLEEFVRKIRGDGG